MEWHCAVSQSHSETRIWRPVSKSKARGRMFHKMEDIKKISAKLEESNPQPENVKTEKVGALAKMKAFVRKAVDCCIE